MLHYIHHHPGPEGDPTKIPIGNPARFEGPAHRDAVLLGARTALLLTEIQQAANTDELTHLPNRRAFNDSFEQIMSEAESTGDTNIALVFFDLDNFKKINDLNGHPVGDEMLVAVADILETMLGVRCEDGEILARLGGDEFAAVLRTINRLNDQRDKNLSDEQIIDGFSSRLNETLIKVASRINAPSFGVSLGVVKFRDKGHEQETHAEFKKRADDEMYKAKNARKVPSTHGSDAQ